MAPVLIVVSETDPVAVRVAERWGTPPGTGEFVEGSAVRRLGPEAWLLRRPGPHIHDERLDRKLPTSIAARSPTLVFPSIHRGEQNIHCLTVHPLGNPGPSAEVGGRPRTLCPTDPLRMACALRVLSQEASRAGLGATFEATHHGPELGLPAFFVEIGYGTDAEPSSDAVDILARTIPEIAPAVGDRVALALGGGHYAPHFSDLAVRRRWAFGHILSRHALAEIDRATADAALRATPGAEGIVFARAGDADHPALGGLAPRLRDAEAPPREDAAQASTRAARSSSGT